MSDDSLFEGFETRRIQTFGAEIHMRLGGAGRPVVLLHGFPQCHAMWHKIAPRLQDDFSLVIPDLRGYGDSSCPANDADNFTYSKRAMAQDIVQVMEGLGHDRFAVVGHDRGARVAYRMALDYPERVSRVAVLDIVPTHTMWEALDVDAAMRIYHWLFLAQPSPLPEMLIARSAVDFQDYTLASWTKSRDLAAFSRGALDAYHRFYSRADNIRATCDDYRAGQTYDRFADKADFSAGRKIKCPVLALWGDAGIPGEGKNPLTIWKRWAKDVRGQGIDAGHFVAEENPDATLKALIPFLFER